MEPKIYYALVKALRESGRADEALQVMEDTRRKRWLIGKSEPDFYLEYALTRE